MVVLIGGRLQGWFLLIGLPCNLPAVPGICTEPPPTLDGTSSQAHQLAMSLIIIIVLNFQLTSLPIDELGEGTYESGWWCQAKCDPQAGCHGNHHQALSHRKTQWRYLLTSILTKASQERGKGRGKLLHKCTTESSKLHKLPEQVRVI